jgi:hypothetical protein
MGRVLASVAAALVAVALWYGFVKLTFLDDSCLRQGSAGYHQFTCPHHVGRDIEGLGLFFLGGFFAVMAGAALFSARGELQRRRRSR